jgi:Arc/MetJ-type ribon-helix-helix transcriptional regulator
MMKRVRVALDESLVQEVDRAAQAVGTTRSAFTRDALREALERFRERQQRVGNKKKPVQPEEIRDYLADLIAEVGPPTAPQRTRAAAIAHRIARRSNRQTG